MVKLALAIRGRRAADLTDVIGVSEPQVSQRLRGTVPLKVPELIAIARFLEIEPSVFFKSPESLVTNSWFTRVEPTSPYEQMEIAYTPRPDLALV